MLKRIMVGLSLFAVLLGALLWGAWQFAVLVAVFMCIANYEINGALKRVGYKPVRWIG